MTTTRRVRSLPMSVAALAIALSCGLAGCGGDDESGAADGSSETAGAEPTSEVTAEPTTEPTTEPTSEPTAAEPSAASSDYCAEIEVLSSLPELGDGSGDEEALTAALEAFESLAQEAPAEVADEWEVALPAFQAYLTIVQRGLVDAQDPPSGTSQAEAEAANDEVLRTAYAEIEPVRSQIDVIGEHAGRTCGAGTF